jgi:hypothetical protein
MRCETSASSWRLVIPVACCLGLLCGTEAKDTATEKESGFTLDLTNRSATRPIPATAVDIASVRFVAIDIANVVNSKRVRLTFEVFYQPRGGGNVLLGSFALFPPDHPGRFIVATGGRLRSGGTIALSMNVLDTVGPSDDVRVSVRGVSFTSE